MRFLRRAFVIFSCTITTVLIVVGFASAVTVVVFDAGWARRVSREIGDRILLWGNSGPSQEGATEGLAPGVNPILAVEPRKRPSRPPPAVSFVELSSHLDEPFGRRELPPEVARLEGPLERLVAAMAVPGRAEPELSGSARPRRSAGSGLLQRAPELRRALETIVERFESYPGEFVRGLSSLALGDLLSREGGLEDSEVLMILRQLGPARSAEVVARIGRLDPRQGARLTRLVLEGRSDPAGGARKCEVESNGRNG